MDVLAAPRISLWLLRAVLTAHVIATLTQPVLAGLFLTGDVDAIDVHAAVASLVGSLGLAAAGIAVAYVLAGRGARWVLPVAVLLVAAEVTQIVLGYQRELQFHVPLGVAIVTASVLLAVWVWSPAAGRAR